MERLNYLFHSQLFGDSRRGYCRKWTILIQKPLLLLVVCVFRRGTSFQIPDAAIFIYLRKKQIKVPVLTM